LDEPKPGFALSVPLITGIDVSSQCRLIQITGESESTAPNTFTYILLLWCITDKMVVVKLTAYTKSASAFVQFNSYNFADTFNPELGNLIIRRRNQYFQQNVTPNRWTSAANDECTVERDILREPTFRVLSSVVPVKNHWQPKLVTNGSSAFRIRGSDERESHTRLKLREPLKVRKTLNVRSQGGPGRP
jgi:hypothetical protein